MPGRWPAGSASISRDCPPRPTCVERFVADTSPEAYEKLVDELLQSPHWGEHRGRYWLDYARYADTHGIHFDNYREMWSYRDWVIQAFNSNLPFDEFTSISLAGDLLPNPTLEQLIGSGFNRCNMTTNEGGIIDEEYVVLYTRDRTETTSRVWMGLTAGCAVCHDHKFDPLSQREFYEMAAFFNNTTQGPRDGNIKDTPPIIVVPTAADRTRWEALQTEVPAAQQRVDDRQAAARGEFDQWLARGDPRRVCPACSDRGAASASGAQRRQRPDAGGHARRPDAPGAGDAARELAGGTVVAAGAGDFPRRSGRTAGRRRLREQPGFLLRGVDQAAGERLGRGDRRPHG